MRVSIGVLIHRIFKYVVEVVNELFVYDSSIELKVSNVTKKGDKYIISINCFLYVQKLKRKTLNFTKAMQSSFCDVLSKVVSGWVGL